MEEIDEESAFYWGYTIGDWEDVNFPDEFYKPPKKFRSGYDQNYDHVKCPAWKKWGDNCWVVEQPFRCWHES